jgi:hypothetical protein
MSTLTPKECIAKYPNAGGGGGVVHEQEGTMSAVLMDGIGRNPFMTTQHGIGSSASSLSYVCGVPRSVTGSWLYDAWAPGLA